MRRGIIAAVVAMGTLVTAQEVRTDYDHAYDFSQIHTFAVKVGTSWGNPLSEQRVVEAVTNALEKRGLTRADPASADSMVVVHGASQTKKSLDTFYSGGWGGYGWGGFGGAPGTSTTTVNEYKVGTLVVDIFDAKSKKLVFRGVGQDEVSDKPEKNTKKVDKATEKMFKNFPPHEKEKG
jgi:hypothetical protein